MRVMKNIAIAMASVGAIALASGLRVAPAASEAPPAPIRTELSPLSFLIGFCWTGVFPDGKQTDTHCFQSVFDGVFVRDRHSVVGGPQLYQGETLYHWSSDTRMIEYTYWNSIGGISRGTVTPTPRGLSFPDESYEGPDGETIEISSSWEPLDDAAFESVTVEKPRNGEPRERRVRYERRPFSELPLTAAGAPG